MLTLDKVRETHMGHTMTESELDTVVPRFDWKVSVRCFTCKAAVGVPCATYQGQILIHPSRGDRLNRLSGNPFNGAIFALDVSLFGGMDRGTLVKISDFDMSDGYITSFTRLFDGKVFTSRIALADLTFRCWASQLPEDVWNKNTSQFHTKSLLG